MKTNAHNQISKKRYAHTQTRKVKLYELSSGNGNTYKTSVVVFQYFNRISIVINL